MNLSLKVYGKGDDRLLFIFVLKDSFQLKVQADTIFCRELSLRSEVHFFVSRFLFRRQFYRITQGLFQQVKPKRTGFFIVFCFQLVQDLAFVIICGEQSGSPGFFFCGYYPEFPCLLFRFWFFFSCRGYLYIISGNGIGCLFFHQIIA